MDGDTANGALREYQQGFVSLRRSYLHALRICLRGRPCGSSIAARCRCGGRRRGGAGWGGKRDLGGGWRGDGARARHGPLTRLLLDSNFVSMTDMARSSSSDVAWAELEKSKSDYVIDGRAGHHPLSPKDLVGPPSSPWPTLTAYSPQVFRTLPDRLRSLRGKTVVL